MTTIASQITSLAVVYSTVYSDADQRKHQSSASLAFVWGIHWDRWIPRTKGQLRGKCFHLMTSSWYTLQAVSMDIAYVYMYVYVLKKQNHMVVEYFSCYFTRRPGVGVTKPISSVPLFSEIFNIFKTHIMYWISRLYLAGVTAAQLWWHLLNINVTQRT